MLSKLRKKKEDNVVIVHERTHVVLNAADTVALRVAQKSFYDMSVEEKQNFLKSNIPAIIKSAIANGGPQYHNLNDFHIFIIEKDGNAGLYFEKKK